MNYKKSRAAAAAAGDLHYRTGKACRNGHFALRDTKRGVCAECARDREKRRWLENKSSMRRKQKRWREKNPDYAKNRRQQELEQAAGRPRAAACECCGKEQRGRALAFDHCHTTGAFRGWLCANCNVGIGKLGDTVAGVRLALEYLQKHEAK